MPRPTRSPRSRCALGAALAACGLTALAPSGPARADERIEYDVAPGCPDRDAFVAAIARRAPGQTPGLSAARLHVQVSATPTGYEGVLRREDELGSSEPRTLAADRCEDLVQGFALTVALSLVTPPAPEPAAAARAEVPPPEPHEGADPRRAYAGVGLRAGAFVAGVPMAGIELEAGLTRGGHDGGAWFGLEWQPALRASWTRSDLPGRSDRARFDLFAGGAELCPAQAGFGRRVRGGLCATAEAGLLRGRGIDVTTPRWASSLWLAAGGGLSSQVALGDRWRILAAAGVQRPLVTTRFVFAEPRMLVASTPAWLVAATVGVAALFP
jgi:hypothetical protein